MEEKEKVFEGDPIGDEVESGTASTDGAGGDDERMRQVEEENTVIADLRQKASDTRTTIENVRDALPEGADGGNGILPHLKLRVTEVEAQLEKQALGLPEEEGSDRQTARSTAREIPHDRIEDIQKELEDARREAVAEYIQDNIEHFLSDFRSELDGSENRRQAESIITNKTRQTFEQMSEVNAFIENGGEIRFDGGWVSLSWAYYDGPNGRKQYITEFDTSELGGVGHGYIDTSEVDSQLVDKKQQAGIDKADERGDLVEQGRK